MSDVWLNDPGDCGWPPVYRKGLWRAQFHPVVLGVTGYIWASALVVLVSPGPLYVDYGTLLGASYLAVFVMACLVSAVEMLGWFSFLVPKRFRSRPASVGVVESLCFAGVLIFAGAASDGASLSAQSNSTPLSVGLYATTG